MPDDVDPATRFKRLDNVGRHDNSPDVLNVAACHWLPVGDDRECFHQGARIARRLLRIQAVEVRLIRGTRAEPPAAGDIHQLNAAPFPVSCKLGEQIAQYVATKLLVEQYLQIRYLERFAAGQQGRLEYAFYFLQIKRR